MQSILWCILLVAGLDAAEHIHFFVSNPDPSPNPIGIKPKEDDNSTIAIVIFPQYFEALNEDEKPGYSSRGTGQAVSVRVMFEGCFYSPKKTRFC